MKIRGGNFCPANLPKDLSAWSNTFPQKWGLHDMIYHMIIWSLYCQMYPQLVGKSLPRYGSHPSYSFHNANMPLESGKLEFHRWMTELNCATCRAAYVQSFWESRNETRGWENTRLPDPSARATAGICTAPYSINIQKPLLHFPKSNETVKASCYVWLQCLSSPLCSVGLFGWLLVVFCFYFNLL